MNTDKTENQTIPYHLYLGCEVRITEYTNFGETVFIEKLIQCTTEHAGTDRFEFYFDGENDIDFKLILRPLSSMTEEEAKESSLIEAETSIVMAKNQYWGAIYSNLIKWYLSKGFDLFGLIDSGLAIDSQKVKTDTEE